MSSPATLSPVAAAAASHARQISEPSDFEQLLQRNFTPQDLLLGDNLDRLDRIADRMASGRMTVPEYLRGNIGDCMAIAMQAMLWNMDPFAVAQKTHIVSGRLGYEAQLVNAVLQNSGAVRGLPHYEYRGEGGALECRVGFVPRGGREIVWNEFLKISDITTKNSPLWKVNPKQQLGYLQVKNWARAYAPGAILGVYTVDELEDNFPQQQRSAAPAPTPTPSADSALPACLQEDLDRDLPKMQKIIDSGKKTAADLLATMSTKATFTEAQKAQILALKPKRPAPEPPPPQPDADDDFVGQYTAAEGDAK